MYRSKSINDYYFILMQKKKTKQNWVTKVRVAIGSVGFNMVWLNQGEEDHKLLLSIFERERETHTQTHFAVSSQDGRGIKG